MLTNLEELLSILSDNVWHNIGETAKKLQISQGKFQQAITFLAEANLIQHNPVTKQIKLNQNWKTRLVSQEETKPKTETQTTMVGTIIIPPQQTLVIQCTRITNLTDTRLELEIRINKNIREIAISKIK